MFTYMVTYLPMKQIIKLANQDINIANGFVKMRGTMITSIPNYRSAECNKCVHMYVVVRIC